MVDSVSVISVDELLAKHREELFDVLMGLLDIRGKSGFGSIEIDVYKGDVQEVRVTYKMRRKKELPHVARQRTTSESETRAFAGSNAQRQV